jgi:putative ABC transport system permease protein
MRPEPPRKGGRIWLEHVRAVWSRLSTPWRNALRTLFRHPLRTGAGLFAAAMGTCILVTGFMGQAAIHYLVDFQFFRVSTSDVDLTFKDQRSEEALDEVRRLPGVDRAEPLLAIPCTFHHGHYERRGAITGLAANARLTTPRDAQGRTLRMPTAGLSITRRLADVLHLSPGDRVTVVPIKGERRPVEAPVVQITDSFLGMSVYAELDYLSRLLGSELALTGAQLSLNNSRDDRRALYRQLKELPGIEAINSREQLVERINDTLLKMQAVSIGFLVGFASVIFLGSIVNSSLVNLAERQREVATLIALGYTRWQVGSVFLRESVVTNSLGTLLGMPLGYLLITVVAAQFNNDVMRFPVVSAPWVWTSVALLSLMFVLIAHAIVQWQIGRLDVLEALKVKE